MQNGEGAVGIQEAGRSAGEHSVGADERVVRAIIAGGVSWGVGLVRRGGFLGVNGYGDGFAVWDYVL